MSKTKMTQEYAARLISRGARVKFEDRRSFPLTGRDGNSWGFLDKRARLRQDDCYLFLEVEEGQHHSCTNVLKLWPYLESHRKESVVLAHVFFQGGRSRESSRGRLGCFIAEKMEKALGKRFVYRQLVIDRKSQRIEVGLKELRESLNCFS